MSAHISYFRLGLFVLVGLALIVIGVVVLGAGALMKPTVPAETYFNESVQGLDVGAPVKYLGVEIGKVSWIGFVPAKYKMKNIDENVRFGKCVMVEVALDPSKMPMSAGQRVMSLLRQRVDAGMRVRLQSSITGPTFLGVEYVDPNVYKPMEIAWKPTHAYIPSAPGTMSQVVSAVERLASEIEQAQLAKLADNLNTAILNANGILTSQEMKRTLSGLATASDNAGPAMIEVLKTVRTLNGLVSSQQQNIEVLVRSLRKTGENVSTLSEEAKNNPSGVLFGNPPPRVNPGEKK
jgi:ABC-type transporter Mla subunit MlaD